MKGHAILVNGLLAAIAFVSLFPLLWMLSVSFMPGFLQTVVSLSTICFVCDGPGSVPELISACSFGSVTTIRP